MAVPWESLLAYFAGAGAGVWAGALDLVPCSTEPLELVPREAKIESEIEVNMKITMPIVVAFANAD